jgi:hypothetical protein
MKNIIILIIFFSFKICYSQSKVLNRNINEINIKVEKLNQNINNLKIEINKQKLINENSQNEIITLNKDLLFYKVKEDYYATALSEQSTRFALIVSGILALFALISFSGFKYETARIQKESDSKIIRHKKLLKNYSKKLKGTKGKLLAARANLNITIAVILKKEKDYSNAFNYYVSGAKDRIYKKKIEDDKSDVLLHNLNSAKEMLDKITNDEMKKSLLEKKDLINKYLTKISVIKNDEVQILCSKIRVKYEELIENIA